MSAFPDEVPEVVRAPQPVPAPVKPAEVATEATELELVPKKGKKGKGKATAVAALAAPVSSEPEEEFSGAFHCRRMNS